MHGGKGGGYVYTATAPEGPWTKHATGACYYDVGLLIDDDDTMYIASGNTNLSVAQLSKDGFSQVKSQQVFTSPSKSDAGRSRFYKINGNYYILTTQYANGSTCSRPQPLRPLHPADLCRPCPHARRRRRGTPTRVASSRPERRLVLHGLPRRVPRRPHAGAGPLKWGQWLAHPQLVNGGWGASYPFPNVPRRRAREATHRNRHLRGMTLDPEWEWNHNPDNTKWSLDGGLTLRPRP